MALSIYHFGDPEKINFTADWLASGRFGSQADKDRIDNSQNMTSKFWQNVIRLTVKSKFLNLFHGISP